jgi:hypothetical protein
MLAHLFSSDLQAVQKSLFADALTALEKVEQLSQDRPESCLNSFCSQVEHI